MNFSSGHFKTCDPLVGAKLNSTSAGFDGSLKSIVTTSGTSLTSQDIAAPKIASLTTVGGTAQPLATGAPNTGSTSGSIAPSFDNHHTPVMHLPKH